MDSKKRRASPKQTDAARTLRADPRTWPRAPIWTPDSAARPRRPWTSRTLPSAASELEGVGTFAIILITLLIIFRSPLMAVLPLVSDRRGRRGRQRADRRRHQALRPAGQRARSRRMLIVVLLGVGTDYFLFLMFRYRERLRAGDEPKQAMVNSGRAGSARPSPPRPAQSSSPSSRWCCRLSGFLKQIGPALAIRSPSPWSRA